MRSAGFSLIFALFIAVGSAAAQSGRVKPESTPIPSPIPVPQPTSEQPELPSSESQPRSTRVIRPSKEIASRGPALVVVSPAMAEDDVVKVETNLVTIPVSVFD